MGDVRRHDDARPRVAKNPLQLCQHNPLIFRCLHVCPATWLKTLVFSQSRYRKFSGVSGCEAIYYTFLMSSTRVGFYVLHKYYYIEYHKNAHKQYQKVLFDGQHGSVSSRLPRS